MEWQMAGRLNFYVNGDPDFPDLNRLFWIALGMPIWGCWEINQ
jgi:hypothetical protein